MVDSQPSEEGAHRVGLKGMGVGSQEGPFKPASLAQETPFLAFINENIDILRTMIKELDQQTKRRFELGNKGYNQATFTQVVAKPEQVQRKAQEGKNQKQREETGRPEPTPFTARITRFKYHRRAKLSRNITMYGGNKDPEDHLSILSADAKKEEWPMSV
ncbi:hypothetical protein Tco_0195785 [Tanacetum coccineum]